MDGFRAGVDQSHPGVLSLITPLSLPPQNHYGGLDGGHYTAYCKNVLKQRWYKFDDHEVSEISTSSVKSSAAYILFYSTL